MSADAAGDWSVSVRQASGAALASARLPRAASTKRAKYLRCGCCTYEVKILLGIDIQLVSRKYKI